MTARPDRRRWLLIAASVTAVVALSAGLAFAVTRPGTDATTPPPQAAATVTDSTAPGTGPAADPAGTGEPAADHVDGEPMPDDWIQFDYAQVEEFKRLAHDAAVAYLTFDTTESDDARAERLSPWFTREQALTPPKLARDEDARTIPGFRAEIIVDEAKAGQGPLDPVEGEDFEFIQRVLVSMDFRAYWTHAGGATSMYTDLRYWEVRIPYRVNADRTGFERSDGPIEIIEPAELPGLPPRYQ